MILLTGASGYIGSRLLRQLEAAGSKVRCLAREPARVAASRDSTEVMKGDCLDASSLDAAMAGVDQAFYLVHSMASGARFAELDRQAAANFGHAARRAGVRRIIYLGGLADDADSLSTHLKSRVETGETLRGSGVPVVEFRASIVIGAGSVSFEMIRALVERLPAMICPRWVDTRTQPIAIDDLLAFLGAALDLPEGREGVFEIGGPEVVSYGDMMREYAKLRGLRRVLIPVPVLTPRLSGLWLGLVTPAQARIGRALVEGLRNSTVVRSAAAIETFTIRPRPLQQAFRQAIDEDGPSHVKTDSRVAVLEVSSAQAFAPIRCIGGNSGWYFADALWRLRGWIDRRFGGEGMPRSRRDPDGCVVGDVIDGWHIEAYEPDRLMRLSAGLKLPGRGWLEFRVIPLAADARSLVRLTATFEPKGISGRLYWYAVLPLHAFVFSGLLRRIAQRATRDRAIGEVSTFTHSSIIAAPVADAFRWHEQPGALAALIPEPLVRIEEQQGGIRDNGRVTISIGLGRARGRWSLRHYGYVDGRRFCDEQVAGPFAFWRHVHVFEPIGPSQTLYEDRIEFAVSRHRTLNLLAVAMLRPLLRIGFAHRHRLVRSAIGNTGERVVPRWAASLMLLAATTLPLAAGSVQTTTLVRAVPFVDLDRQPDVHQHDLRQHALCDGHGIGSVVCFVDLVAFKFQQHRERLGRVVAVVDHEDAARDGVDGRRRRQVSSE